MCIIHIYRKMTKVVIPPRLTKLGRSVGEAAMCSYVKLAIFALALSNLSFLK